MTGPPFRAAVSSRADAFGGDFARVGVGVAGGEFDDRFDVLFGEPELAQGGGGAEVEA